MVQLNIKYYDDVLNLAKKWHGNQKRKYTGEPYTNHVISVANIVEKYDGDNNQIYAALLHDVLEDTSISEAEIKQALIDMGFLLCDAVDVVKLVVELTDVYTHEEYPHQNRKLRKIHENRRFSKVSKRAKFIKCADLIDNGKSIAAHDTKFAKVYLKEKLNLLLSWSNPMSEYNNLLHKRKLEHPDLMFLKDDVESIWMVAWLECHISINDLMEEEEISALLNEFDVATRIPMEFYLKTLRRR